MSKVQKSRGCEVVMTHFTVLPTKLSTDNGDKHPIKAARNNFSTDFQRFFENVLFFLP